MPEMLIMPVINFAKVSNFAKVCAAKSDISELSEKKRKGSEEERKDFW